MKNTQKIAALPRRTRRSATVAFHTAGNHRSTLRWMNPLKFLTIVSVCVGVAVLIPLTQVWKQVYITEISLRQQSLKDSCAVLSKQLYSLTLEAGTLSKNERIERIAKTQLHLVYPLSKDIIVLRTTKDAPIEKGRESEIVTAIRRSFLLRKG